jgi:hypothetical protein
MKKIYIIAGGRVVDGLGSHSETQKVLSTAIKKKLKVITLEIVPLSRGWEDRLASYEFKSGASAMTAIDKARVLLKTKKADLVIIKGSDYLKTGYEKKDREKFMQLYGKKLTPLDGYHRLVPLFLRYHKLSEKDYFVIRDALFLNYTTTYKKINPEGVLPEERWMRPLTKYFRGVDCANPNVDYSGQILLASDKTSDQLKIPKKKRVEILGNASTKLSVDGMESLPKIAPYLHLKRTITKALSEAKLDFKKEFLKNRALLDAYTCYPIVPLGLILRLGLVKNLKDIPELLKNQEVTVTGGLNLGKAPWNLTSLNAIIVMRHKLILSKKYQYGLVHGNGSLGNQQGITILSAGE